MTTNKKKILWLSDFSKLKTGFGRNSREVLTYLYKTGKYEIIEYATGPLTEGDQRLESVPWKAYGAIPNDQGVLMSISNNPGEQERVRYGSYFIDEIVAKEKPDVFIGVNDFWGFADFYDKPWWNKFPCALWITLDSLPIFKPALENAHKIKNFWVWTSFAEREMKRLGFNHIQTLHGAIDCETFHPLSKKEIAQLKAKHGLKKFKLFGFVFRNQLRKQVHSLLEGYSKFKKDNPEKTKDCKVYLHTNWSEGWDIKSFIEEYELSNDDVITSYICAACGDFSASKFVGEQAKCTNCGNQALYTPKTDLGLSESQMNQVYNMIDFYIHPITSGGLEIPLVEALMSGTPISTVNYSCGEEFCNNDFVKKIDFTTTREISTGFIKAVPSAQSISKAMEWYCNLSEEEIEEIKQLGRKWAENEFDTQKICKRIEDFIDSAHHDYAYDFPTLNTYNESYIPDKSLPDLEWALDLVKGVFGREENERAESIVGILKNLQNGETREAVLEKAHQAAKSHNAQVKQTDLENKMQPSPSGNLAFVTPGSVTEKIQALQILRQVEEPIVIIGDPIDETLFAECGPKVVLPKNNKTQDFHWLLRLRDNNDNKRFTKILFKNGLSYDIAENQ